MEPKKKINPMGPAIAVGVGIGTALGIAMDNLALGIGIGDKVFMLEHTWYSVISPESCSSILWRSWDFKEQAATALKLTAENMLEQKLIDGIIKEPIGGAHVNQEESFQNVKKEILKQVAKLEKIEADKRIEARIEKFSAMGVFVEA